MSERQASLETGNAEVDPLGKQGRPPRLGLESDRTQPFLTQHEDALWRYDAAPDSIPLMFSIKARKE